MELLCVELILKRRELLKMNEIEDEEMENDGEDNEGKSKQEDAILSCKIVEIVFKNALKQFKGYYNINKLK